MQGKRTASHAKCIMYLGYGIMIACFFTMILSFAGMCGFETERKDYPEQ